MHSERNIGNRVSEQLVRSTATPALTRSRCATACVDSDLAANERVPAVLSAKQLDRRVEFNGSWSINAVRVTPFKTTTRNHDSERGWRLIRPVSSSATIATDRVHHRLRHDVKSRCGTKHRWHWAPIITRGVATKLQEINLHCDAGLVALLVRFLDRETYSRADARTPSAIQRRHPMPRVGMASQGTQPQYAGTPKAESNASTILESKSAALIPDVDPLPCPAKTNAQQRNLAPPAGPRSDTDSISQRAGGTTVTTLQRHASTDQSSGRAGQLQGDSS